MYIVWRDLTDQWSYKSNLSSNAKLWVNILFSHQLLVWLNLCLTKIFLYYKHSKPQALSLSLNYEKHRYCVEVKEISNKYINDNRYNSLRLNVVTNTMDFSELWIIMNEGFEISKIINNDEWRIENNKIIINQ